MDLLPFPDLHGPRVALVALDDSGLHDMHEYSIDPRFFQYLEYVPHRSIDDTVEYLEVLKRRSSSGSAHYWFIRLRDSGKVIGTFGVHHIDRKRGNAEIGYGVAPKFWGRGYFQECLQLVLSYLFARLGFHRVSATTARANRPSIRSLERAGFSREGVLRDYYCAPDGTRFDAVIMSLLRDEFVRLHQGGAQASVAIDAGLPDRTQGMEGRAK